MDNQSQPPEEGLQAEKFESDQSSNNESWPLIILSALVVALLVGGGIFVWQKARLNQIKEEKNAKVRELEQQILSLQEEVDNLKEKTPDPNSKKGSEIVEIDDTWNEYRNFNLGFSIKFPKQILGNNPFCDDSSPEMTPVGVYEGSSAVYITEKSFYRKQDCKKMETTFNRLEDESIQKDPHRASWKIITQKAKDQKEVENFIKNHYGEACSLEFKEDPARKGVYSIDIKGNPSEGCIVNFMYVAKYSPAVNRVVVWNMGQDYEFPAGSQKTYDEMMKESFNFLES